jgi:hypothetical protein
VKEKLIAILEQQQQKELITFLQTLSTEQKKELIPVIKKLEKEYLTVQMVPTGPNTARYEQKGSETQRTILLLSAFVCFSRAEFERVNNAAYVLDKKILDAVLDWYCPDWFSDFVIKEGEQEFIIHYLNYGLAVDLMQRGHLRVSRELIAKLLPAEIYDERDGKAYYVPGKLLEHPVTLEEHIWYLFEAESNIYHAGRWLRNVIGGSKDDGYSAWGSVFKQYIGEGRLNRQRVLQESLHASNRNFNKLASGWFIDLFSKLEPSHEELLGLQKELFAVLGSPHSKPVNTVLQYVKRLMTDKAFERAGFLDYMAVLLSSATKSVVAATLGILEKLSEKHADDRLIISRSVLQVFIHADDELQSKAAKLIVANKASLDNSFISGLSVFADTMTTSARRLLDDFLQTPKEAMATLPVEEISPQVMPAALVPLPAVENLDDLVFLASQALDNNQSWHIDVLPAALIRWEPELQGAAVARLEPALQRALKLIKKGLTSVQGELDHMLSVFLIDIGVLLTRSRGEDAVALDKLFNAYKQGSGSNTAYWQNIGSDTSYMAGVGTDRENSVYIPYKQLLLLAVEKFRRGDTLPLLSTPTHEPGWIVPKVFVERLLQYQQASQWPDDMDLQVAISRCYLENAGDAIELAEQQLQGEYRNLCLFLFGKQEDPQGDFHHPTAWMVASLALQVKKQYPAFESFGFYQRPFSCYTGQFDWESIHGEHTNDRYDHQLGKYVEHTSRYQFLKVYFPKKENEEAPDTAQAARPLLLYDLLGLKKHYFDIQHSDIRRLLMLIPGNPEPLLAHIMDTHLTYSTFWEESSKKTIIAVLQCLHEIWDRTGNMAHVFIGACMLSSDKTAAGIAAEIWLKQVSFGKIDSASLGKAIGLHECVEYAPMKRFTDLVNQRLLRVSALHNRELQVLIEYVLQELPDEPVTNLKKLLEVFLENLELNKAAVTNSLVIDKLGAWQKNTGVKKIATQLIACTKYAVVH